MDEKPFWKGQRNKILNAIIHVNSHNYDIFSLPTNAVRSYQRKDISEVPFDRQEEVLFNDFLAVCRGANGPYIQCMQKEAKPIFWNWASENYKRENPNVCRWMETCLEMATSLIQLQQILAYRRNSHTQGPTVYTYCSLVLHFLRKNVFAQLNELDQMEGKNLLTLKRFCNDMNGRILSPLLHVSKQIEENEKVGGELINFLFDQKSQTDCYHITGLLDEIISMALLRYNQIIFEWISQCTLTSDLLHEFFIWDLRKQKAVKRNEFKQGNERDWSDFDDNFVEIPELLPEDYRPVAKEIYNLGRYLYTMKQQNAVLDHLSAQYLLDIDSFKNKSLGEFCASIVRLYAQCSENILAHFTLHYDIVNFAKHLPYFFIGFNSSWLFEFVMLFEERQVSNNSNDLKRIEKYFPQFLQQAFQSTWLQTSHFCKNFDAKLSPFINGQKSNIMIPEEGKYPHLELHIVGNESAMKLAFPACVLEPYRMMFDHLILLNRAKYAVNRKYFLRRCVTSQEELATLHLFLRFLNIYEEYFYSVVSKEYGKFARKLDSVRTLDELVQTQTDFVNDVMGQMKLDQEYTEFKEWIGKLVITFYDYANDEDEMDFLGLNHLASGWVIQIKKFLLDRGRHVGPLRDLLFGNFRSFPDIGFGSGPDDPIWKLMLQVDV